MKTECTRRYFYEASFINKFNYLVNFFCSIEYLTLYDDNMMITLFCHLFVRNRFTRLDLPKNDNSTAVENKGRLTQNLCTITVSLNCQWPLGGSSEAYFYVY